MRLSPLGTFATRWPVVAAPDTEVLWKHYPSVVLCTKNFTRLDLDSNSGLRCGSVLIGTGRQVQFS